MPNRDANSAADYVFTAISPALIMLMVGSLIFFLITVLPTGDYKKRLLYTTFFFVFGAVLVARIAIQFDAGRATMYGLGLGIVTFLAMTAYVAYPGKLQSFGWLLNIGFLALIWWSAHKLTWDCTHLDENKDASGRGLLAASGLESEDSSLNREPAASAPQPPTPLNRKPSASAPQSPTPTNKKKRKKKSPPPKRESAFSAWTTRWWNHHDKQKTKPHTPGVWVIYFSLAALPLFAVGQSLIPSEDGERRRAAFLQMAAYVGSGLGLLVTTSLLGLRRYLRQKKAKMPAALTAGWLGLGAMLIAVFLVIGALMPRPYSETPWFGLSQAGKQEREASKYAQLRDSAGKGDGAGGDKFEKGNGNASGKNGNPGGSKGEKGSAGKGDKQGNASPGDNQSSPGDNRASPRRQPGEDQDSKASLGDNKSNPGDNKASPRRQPGEDQDSKSSPGDNKSNPGRQPGEAPRLGGLVARIATFAKWLVIAIVVIAVGIAIALAVLRYLAPFTNWARSLLDALRNWWESLFGKKKSGPGELAAEVGELGPVRPPPFTEFSNPFADGSADRRRLEELIEYTFAALDSWAWDRGLGREPTETPIEFASRLGIEFPGFEANLRKMGNTYARMAYADAALPRSILGFLEQFWEQLVYGVNIAAGEPAFGSADHPPRQFDE